MSRESRDKPLAPRIHFQPYHEDYQYLQTRIGKYGVGSTMRQMIHDAVRRLRAAEAREVDKMVDSVQIQVEES